MVSDSEKVKYISLWEAAKVSPYSQEYLSLRARHGKLRAVKQGRNWMTTKEWLEAYCKAYSRNDVKANPRFSFLFAGKASVIVAVIFALLFGSAFGMEGVFATARTLDERVQSAAELAREEFLRMSSEAVQTFASIDSGIQSIGNGTRVVLSRALSVARTDIFFADAFVDAFAQEFRSNSSIAFTKAKGNVFYADLLISIPAENFRAEYTRVLRDVDTRVSAFADATREQLARHAKNTETQIVFLADEARAQSMLHVQNVDAQVSALANAARALPPLALQTMDDVSTASTDNGRLFLASAGSLASEYFSWLAETLASAPKFLSQTNTLLEQAIVQEIQPAIQAITAIRAKEVVSKKAISREAKGVLPAVVPSVAERAKESVRAEKSSVPLAVKEREIVLPARQASQPAGVAGGPARPQPPVQPPAVVKETVKETRAERVVQETRVVQDTETKSKTSLLAQELESLKSRLSEYSASISSVLAWKGDIDSLKSITSKLQSTPPSFVSQPQVITTPVYIGNSGLQVGGSASFESLGVSGSAGVRDLGVGRSASIGKDQTDTFTVNASSTFTNPVVIRSTLQVGTGTINIDASGNITTTGFVKIVDSNGNIKAILDNTGNLTVSGTLTSTASTPSVFPQLTVTGATILSSLSTGIIHASSTGLLSSSAVNLASADVTGILPVANGGTNLSTVAAGSVLGSNTVDVIAAITSTTGLKLLQNNAGAITWETVTGTGSPVLATSPTLVTPTLGAALATSIAIGANTIDTNEWANLDGLNQTLATSSSPTFANLTISTAGAIRTGTTLGNTLLLQAYDNDTGPGYITFATLTAGNTPTFDLATGTTIGTNYIYRATGTDIAVADGGTGVSSWTDGQLLIGNTTGNTAALATLTGTANQITVTNGASSITLSTPQDIATSSSPTFANLTLSTAGALRTGTTLGNTLLLQAYDNDTGPGYITFATLTAGNTPTFDLATGTTIGTNYIYRATGTDIPLADGGTNASLVASNGGIFYSTATAGAILAGTATAGQLLLSGATAAPTWSTTTYPSTNAINTLLYASSANVMAALATANSGVLVTSGTGVPSIATDIPTAVTIGTNYIYRATGTDVAVADGGTGVSSWTDGQLLIGNTTGNTAALATLTGTANQITVTNGASSITLSTPQDIATASTPRFARAGLGAAADATNILTVTSTSTTDLSKGINVSHTGVITGTGYGVYSSVTGASTANVGGYFVATGATTSRGLEVAALTSATSTGLTIGALSGTTANTGITIGALSGVSATGAGMAIGNISTTGTTNYGLQLGTMTGGTTSNYQISTGVLTSATTTTNAQLNLGGIVTTGGTTNYGINVGALSGTGTTNYGINVAASTATGTTNYGMKIGAISGAATNNYGLYVDTVSGAGTGNYAAIFAGGNVGIGTTGPDRRLDVLDASNPQLRLTQADGTIFSEFKVAATTGDLTLSVSGEDFLLNQPGGSTGANIWICEGDACPSINVGTVATNIVEVTPGGNVLPEGAVIFGNEYLLVPGLDAAAQVLKMYGPGDTTNPIVIFDEVAP